MKQESACGLPSRQTLGHTSYPVRCRCRRRAKSPCTLLNSKAELTTDGAHGLREGGGCVDHEGRPVLVNSGFPCCRDLCLRLSASPSAEPKASHRQNPELVIFSWAVAAVLPKAACWVVREEPFPAKRARTRVISKITVVPGRVVLCSVPTHA